MDLAVSAVSIISFAAFDIAVLAFLRLSPSFHLSNSSASLFCSQLLYPFSWLSDLTTHLTRTPVRVPLYLALFDVFVCPNAGCLPRSDGKLQPVAAVYRRLLPLLLGNIVSVPLRMFRAAVSSSSVPYFLTRFNACFPVNPRKPRAPFPLENTTFTRSMPPSVVALAPFSVVQHCHRRCF